MQLQEHRIPLLVEPDADDPECAEIRVDGAVAGRGYRFTLDTGAASTQLLADEFTVGLSSEGVRTSKGVFAARVNSAVTLPEVSVGSTSPVTLKTATLTPASQPGARNLLGMDFLSRYRCHFLFDQRLLLLGPPGPGAAIRTLFLDEVSHPYVDAAWGDVEAACVWDSGAGITVIDHGFLNRHQDLFTPAGVSVGTDATGAQVATPTYLAAAASIGGGSFAPHRVAAVDLSAANEGLERPMDVLLGWTTLRQANWVFDFPGRKWSVTRHSPPGPRRGRP